jgi:hypothetical protein
VSPLWTGAVLPLATAALLAFVGVLMARRPAGEEVRFALRAFAAWWFSAASVMLLVGLPTLLDLAGVADARVYALAVYLLALPLAVGLCALLYYLVYIYTGRRAAIRPLAVAYALFLVFELAYFASFGPRRVETTAWSVRTVGASSPPQGLSVLFGVLLAAPILSAVVAYASLYFRTRRKAHRYRIVTVSAAFTLWFGPVLLGLLLGWERTDWFPLVYEVPGIVAAVLIVLAYKPPGAIRRRLRLEEAPS